MKRLKPETVTIILWYSRLLDFMTKADAAKKEEYKQMNLYDVLFSLDFLLEQQELSKDEIRGN